MIQAWLMLAPPSKFYTVSTVLFHKDWGANVAVTNWRSHFSMFIPTKATMKLANGNTGHAQWIGIILCCFTNCSIIYPVGPVYYFTGHPSKTISSGALKFYIGFLKGYIWTSWTLWLFWPSRSFLDITLLDSQQSWLYSTRSCPDQSSQRQESCCPNCLWTFKANSLSQLIHQHFSHVSINRLKSPWIVRALPYLSTDQGN